MQGTALRTWRRHFGPALEYHYVPPHQQVVAKCRGAQRNRKRQVASAKWQKASGKAKSTLEQMLKVNVIYI
ncbi:unnamed protein product [Ceratitis capitata]|uniref:(Mediterranean fruit fly) hypothetical protein n=1 Tax=Ceratitis capitata TaxID=7213 RepID=A0A811V8B1_CERCA|nr:unnamed protein product [Ceratitis capitata]